MVAFHSSSCEPRRRNHSIQPSKPCSRGFGIVILYKSLSYVPTTLQNRDNLKRYELTAKLLYRICRARIICDIQLSLSSVLKGLGQSGLGGESAAASSGDLTLSSAIEALNTATCFIDCITTNHCYLVYN